MCGEYGLLPSVAASTSELPPHARRIRTDYLLCRNGLGTTSAYAENTASTIPPPRSLWNYLRMRGEYTGSTADRDRCWELPPRTRRIRKPPRRKTNQDGTTSACAENTPVPGTPSNRSWNYLRVRGEYWRPSSSRMQSSELPPRVRRIPFPGFLGGFVGGTTSACAENTGLGQGTAQTAWNYLRVCGEYDSCERITADTLELPPHTRRIRPCCNCSSQ